MEGFGAVRAAISVLVVVLALMARVSYLWKLLLYRKVSIASCPNVSSRRGSSIPGCSALIVVVRVCIFLDIITSGLVDSVQLSGQRVNTICGKAQSTSGLWACSQSVPRIISWSPSVVT